MAGHSNFKNCSLFYHLWLPSNGNLTLTFKREQVENDSPTSPPQHKKISVFGSCSFTPWPQVARNYFLVRVLIILPSFCGIKPRLLGLWELHRWMKKPRLKLPHDRKPFWVSFMVEDCCWNMHNLALNFIYFWKHEYIRVKEVRKWHCYIVSMFYYRIYGQLHQKHSWVIQTIM